MAFSINKTTLAGNLGQAPEVKQLNEGGLIATISLATTETWKDQKTGKKESKTEWHKVVFYNRLAEIVSEFLTKGSSIYIEGKIVYKTWNDEAKGIKRYSTEIVADELKMIPSSSTGSKQNQTNQADNSEDTSVIPFTPADIEAINQGLEFKISKDDDQFESKKKYLKEQGYVWSPKLKSWNPKAAA